MIYKVWVWCKMPVHKITQSGEHFVTTEIVPILQTPINADKIRIYGTRKKFVQRLKITFNKSDNAQ